MAFTEAAGKISDHVTAEMIECVPAAATHDDPPGPFVVPDPPSPTQTAQEATLTVTGADPPPATS